MSLLRRYRTMDERHDTTRPIGEGAFVAPYMTRAYERSGVCPAPYAPCQHPLTHLLHKLPRWKRTDGLRRFTRLSRYFIVKVYCRFITPSGLRCAVSRTTPALRAPECLNQVVTRLDFALYIDAMQVSLDGTRTNHKFVSNILDIESTQYECKHFLFTL